MAKVSFHTQPKESELDLPSRRIKLIIDSSSTQSLLISCCILMAILLTLAASSVSAGHKGHVHINVWRGPSKGHKKHKFAPWGYYAKLPADESKKKKHG